MGIEVKGLDELQRRLRKLQENARKLEKSSSVPFSQIFDPDFMRAHTTFPSWESFAIASGLFADGKLTQENFRSIPDDKWDSWIRGNSHFANWKSMMEAAAAEFAKKKLFGDF